ncbi:hypothetical protein Ciccas_008633 [Cichlidogyrus casuarinus]|uniref:Uncharacterized protein n=1 Tax=Cichlidogyrus casuarinus TaxID=1844966 RepID=A0ABD2PZI0_9PLAT
MPTYRKSNKKQKKSINKTPITAETVIKRPKKELAANSKPPSTSIESFDITTPCPSKVSSSSLVSINYVDCTGVVSANLKDGSTSLLSLDFIQSTSPDLLIAYMTALDKLLHSEDPQPNVATCPAVSNHLEQSIEELTKAESFMYMLAVRVADL